MSATLLDTHVLIWLMEGDPSLGPDSRHAVDTAGKENSLLVSAITFWEVAMLAQRGRIILSHPVRYWRRGILDLGVAEMPVSGEVGILAAELQHFHPDPADRIIAASALVHGATLITADGRILEWAGSLPRQNARI